MNSLTDQYPPPWSLEAADNHPRGAWTIYAANGAEVMFCAEFTGDGATIGLSTQQARELCALINLGANG